MNRAESVKGLVTRCRGQADKLADALRVQKNPQADDVNDAVIDLRQLSNEVEDFAGMVDNEESAFYSRLRRHMTQALGSFMAQEIEEEPWFTTYGGDKMHIQASTHALTLEASITYERRHPA